MSALHRLDNLNPAELVGTEATHDERVAALATLKPAERGPVAVERRLAAH